MIMGAALEIRHEGNGHGCLWVIVSGPCSEQRNASRKAGAHARTWGRTFRRGRAHRLNPETPVTTDGTRFEMRALFAFAR